MGTKINIAAILESKPQGTKLYSLTYGDCSYQGYTGDFGIECQSQNGVQFNLDEYGKYCIEGECILFPSKEMRDWSKFAWKKGDVLISNDGKKEVFFNGFTDDTYALFKAKHGFEVLSNGNTIYLAGEDGIATSDYTLGDKDTAQNYINTIEERLGGKLNRETLEVEKPQPGFKDGDIAFADYGNRQDVFIVSGITGLSEGYSSFISLDLSSLILSMACRTSFFKKDLCKLRLATEEEKQQLFSALAKKGKAWGSEKKEVVDLKPKVELKPFDNVLSRRCSEDYWVLNFYSHKTDYYHICIDGSSNLYCIPYNEETAHLLGTTDEWKGGEG